MAMGPSFCHALPMIKNEVSYRKAGMKDVETILDSTMGGRAETNAPRPSVAS
jgi:hypothetical protein